MQRKTVQDIIEGHTIVHINRKHNNPKGKVVVLHIAIAKVCWFNRKAITYGYRVGLCHDSDNNKDYMMYTRSPKAKVVYINNTTIDKKKSKFKLVEVNDE